MLHLKDYLILFTCIAASAAAAAPLPPPTAPVRPVTDDYFGTKVVDNYRYFENLKDPEVQKWMKSQADFPRETLDALPGYQALLKRTAELYESQPAEVSDVQIVGGGYYTLRPPQGTQSPKLYLRDGVKGEDRLLIDPEELPGSAKVITAFIPIDLRPMVIILPTTSRLVVPKSVCCMCSTCGPARIYRRRLIA